MEETAPVKTRRTRSDKGTSRGPRKAPVSSTPILFAAEPPAPIGVKIRLKGYPEVIEFGCAERSVENGFHVFLYPSETDRYRYTRREFAISEVVEIEITAARNQVRIETPLASIEAHEAVPLAMAPRPTGRPIIHSARKQAASVIEQLETSDGPIKMDKMPNLGNVSFGDSAG